MNSRLACIGVAVAILSLGFLASRPTAAQNAERKAAPPKPGASIDGYRFEFPCVMAMPENPKEGSTCKSAVVTGDPKTTDNFTAKKVFEGTKGKRYKVTLRFR